MVNLTPKWSDNRAALEAQLHLEKFGVWREADILPRSIGTVLPGIRAGDLAKAEIHPGETI